MKLICSILVICIVLLSVIPFSLGAPAETSSLRNGSDSKSAFGQPFDEIVVESTLNVKRKTNGIRQSRNDQAALIRTKRQQESFFPNFKFPTFGGSAADATAQAQSHEAKSKFGKYGASASGGQSQSLSFGPNGPVGSASFAGSQQYKLPNGETLNVSFGNAVGGTGSNNAGGGAVSISGPRRGHL